MNELRISSTGFPETTKTWNFTQDILKEVTKALSRFAGENIIISGLEVDPNDNTVSDGYIIYNDEILPFVGSLLNTTVSIIETVEEVSYNTDVNDDTVLDIFPAYATRYAICGTGLPNTVSNFGFDELKSIRTLYELSQFEIADASEETKGIAEIATQTEANSETEDTRFITAKKLNNRTATESRRGLSKKASLTQVKFGTDDNNFVTPKKLKDAGFAQVLAKGAVYLGDAPNATNQEIAIAFPDVGTSNYVVTGGFRSVNPAEGFTNNTTIWVVNRKFTNAFTIAVKEIVSTSQNNFFDYALIKL